MRYLLAATCLLLAMTASAAVTVEKTEYLGHEAYRVSNGDVELVMLTDVGPRIIRYSSVGGRNFFVELDAKTEEALTGGQDWVLYGGHRIWVGPEEPSYTYAGDNQPTEVQLTANGLRSTQPVDSAGIRREIEVIMDDSGSGVRVIHRLTNETVWPLRFAPWALSMMAPGGVGVAAFPPRGTHPEHLLPSNPLVMWRFTNFTDPRWTILEKYIVLRQDPARPDPEKTGLFNPKTRAAYLLGSELFVKRYEAPAGKQYPDMGVSFEIFTNAYFLELETLGPLQDVRQGETVEHVETWSLHKNIKIGEWTDAELDRKIGPLLQ